jgi:hypothetical protein
VIIVAAFPSVDGTAATAETKKQKRIKGKSKIKIKGCTSSAV